MAKRKSRNVMKYNKKSQKYNKKRRNRGAKLKSARGGRRF